MNQLSWELWVIAQDFRKLADNLKRIYQIYLKSIKKTRKISTCDPLDLKTLRCWWIMPKIPYKHQWTGENRLLVTDEPVKFQDFKKITHHFREIYRTYLILIKETPKCQPAFWLDLKTLGTRPVMPKNIPLTLLDFPQKSHHTLVL